MPINDTITVECNVCRFTQTYAKRADVEKKGWSIFGIGTDDSPDTAAVCPKCVLRVKSTVLGSSVPDAKQQ